MTALGPDREAVLPHGGPVSAAPAAPASEVPTAGAGISGRIARGGLWTLAAYAATSGSALLISVIVGRALGVEALGRYSYHVWILRVAPTALAFGIPYALTRIVSEKLGSQQPEQARGALRLAARAHLAVLPVCVGVAAGLVAAGRTGLAVATVLLFGVAVQLASLDLEAFLAGLRRFRVLSIMSVATAVIHVGLAFVGLAVADSWEAFIVVYVASLGFGVLVMAVPAARSARALPPAALPPVERSRFFRFAGVVALALAVDAVLWGRPELLFLEWYRSSADLGLYSAAARVASLAVMVPLVAAKVLMPEFSYLVGGDRRSELQAAFTQSCRLLAVLTAPLALIGAVLAGPLVTSIYGDDFPAAGTATAILLGGSLVNIVVGPAAAAVMVGPRPRTIAEVGAAAVVVNLGLAFLLIPWLGPEGAAITNVAVQLLSTLAGAIYTRLAMGLRFPIRFFVAVIGIAVVGAGVSFVVAGALSGAAAVVGAGAAGLGAYLLLLVATRTFTLGDARAALAP